MDQQNTQSSYFALRGVTDFSKDEYFLPPYFLPSLPLDKTISICDLGCGFGRIMSALKKEGYFNICGVDQEVEAIDWCQKEDLEVFQSSIEAFLISSTKKFDFIIMSHVLEHIPKEDIIPILQKIKNQLLAEEGQIFIMVPNAQSSTGCYWAYEDFTHSTLFTAGSLLYVLKAAGFEKITLIDQYCLAGLSKPRLVFRRFLLFLYQINLMFWNKVTASSFHKPSPTVFSYEIKMKAQ